MTLFERVKKTSRDRGLSLLSLNDKAGLGKNAIYKWKTQKPSTDNLKKVANVLNVSVDYLLGNSDESGDPTEKPIVDLNKDDSILTFDGKPIPDEDKEIIRRLLRGK